jgi:polynucleotide 5'-hydroxyl-kinase GRC3/NOL9
MKEWKRAAEEIIASGPRPLKLFILGGPDSGKTTMAAFLASVAAGAGLKVAVVDADVGQSEIGPPGCVGYGLANGPIGRVREIPPLRSYFVGSNSPELLSFTTAGAAKSAVDGALSLSPDLVVIDTTGLVWGRTARFLKSAKIELITPTHIVALQRALELEHLLRPWDHLGGLPKVVRAPVSPRATEKNRKDRRAFRERAFQQYFRGATRREFDLDKISLFRTTYLTGRPMDSSQLAVISKDLRCGIAHAEWLPDGIFIVAEGFFDLEGLERIKEREGTTEVFLTKTDRFENLLVGMVDRDGVLLGVGLLTSLDFRRRAGVVWSPLDSATSDRVAGLQFGILKILPTGEEAGKIHPNDI